MESSLKAKIILCDIEGTTTSISFVKVRYKQLARIKLLKKKEVPGEIQYFIYIFVLILDILYNCAYISPYIVGKFFGKKNIV